VSGVLLGRGSNRSWWIFSVFGGGSTMAVDKGIGKEAEGGRLGAMVLEMFPTDRA